MEGKKGGSADLESLEADNAHACFTFLINTIL